MAKCAAWHLFALAVRAAQAAAFLAGRVRRVDTVIYKVDRLGDWLLAGPAIAAIAAECRSRGCDAVVWASQESAPLRRWRPAPCRVETLVFEPPGWGARLQRAASLLRLLAIYRANNLICLRHGPDPIRELVLRTCNARRGFACTWVIGPGGADVVPHEIRRHWWTLRNAGLAPDAADALLPRFARIGEPVPDRVVVAPFSSAPVKDWPISHWADLAAAFPGGTRWELWAGPGQENAVRAAVAALQAAAPQLSVSGRSGSIRDLAEAVSTARLVISVDSLAAHLAAAYDAPLVALLGGGQFGNFAPWSRGSRQRWLHHPLPCFHCNWRCRRVANDCVRFITPAEVLDAAASLLGSTEETASCASTGTVPSAA